MGAEYNSNEHLTEELRSRLNEQPAFFDKVVFLEGIMARRLNPRSVNTLANELLARLWASATDAEMDGWALREQERLGNASQFNLYDLQATARKKQMDAQKALHEEK